MASGTTSGFANLPMGAKAGLLVGLLGLMAAI